MFSYFCLKENMFYWRVIIPMGHFPWRIALVFVCTDDIFQKFNYYVKLLFQKNPLFSL